MGTISPNKVKKLPINLFGYSLWNIQDYCSMALKNKNVCQKKLKNVHEQLDNRLLTASMCLILNFIAGYVRNNSLKCVRDNSLLTTIMCAIIAYRVGLCIECA